MSTAGIIKLSRTSDNQLLDLAKSLNTKVDQIDFKEKLDLKKDYAIINMGSAILGGTHWCAVSNKHKLYFDPLGLPRPRIIPHDYKYNEVMIQRPQFGRCGQYCVLWLYYLQHGKIADFYKLFRKYTDGSILDDDTIVF